MIGVATLIRGSFTSAAKQTKPPIEMPVMPIRSESTASSRLKWSIRALISVAVSCIARRELRRSSLPSGISVSNPAPARSPCRRLSIATTK